MIILHGQRMLDKVGKVTDDFFLFLEFCVHLNLKLLYKSRACLSVRVFKVKRHSFAAKGKK